MIKIALMVFLFIASVGTGFAAANKKAKTTQPAWMQSRIAELETRYKDAPNPISIQKYKFNGKTFYLMPPSAPCCDIPTELVDESGKSYCQLGGGFANHVDPQCSTFREAGQLLETVWSSSSKK